jgi:ParB family chromosome partitioning protein
MKAVIQVRDVLPNPWQIRKRAEKEALRALSEEIKEAGLWPGSLRGRMKGGKVELCYGHRRLGAIKLLGWDEVEIEIEDLTDDEMALQSLAENFQREGLSDIEKSEGIQMMLERFQKQGIATAEAMRRVSKFIGLSEAWIRDLLSLLHMEGTVRKAIRERKIAGRTALEAHRFGGKEMVQTAVEHKLPVHKISAIAQRVRQIPDEEVREKVKQEIVKGKLVDPEKVDEKAKKLLKGRTPKAPENLDRVLSDWGYIIHHWNEKIDEILVYKRFFVGRNTAGLKSEAAKLARKLQRLGGP